MTDIRKKSLVYTKTGDTGTTSLVGGVRVPKTHARLDAYGTIDELNSFVGSLICVIAAEDDLSTLLFIQHRLFTVGSYLATETETMTLNERSTLKEADIIHLENEIDRIESQLPQLTQFVLPSGCEAASRAHICRTVCRRAERNIYHVKENFPVDDIILKFVNRLSDYFFLLARQESHKLGNEIFWNNTCG